MRLPEGSSNKLSGSSATILTPALTDKVAIWQTLSVRTSRPHTCLPSSTQSTLGEPYQEGVKRRMADRLERRTQFAEIDVRSTERFGSLCSPFQALHLPVHLLCVLTLTAPYLHASLTLPPCRRWKMWMFQRNFQPLYTAHNISTDHVVIHSSHRSLNLFVNNNCVLTVEVVNFLITRTHQTR